MSASRFGVLSSVIGAIPRDDRRRAVPGFDGDQDNLSTIARDRRRPSVCATRSTARSSPRSPASFAAVRLPKRITFGLPNRALGRKVSDEYTVPVCRVHLRDLPGYGDEASWWAGVNIDPLPIALELWRSHSQLQGPPDSHSRDNEGSL